MNLKNLTTTFVKNFEDCPARAWDSYQKRLEFGDDNEGTIFTRFGTVVHAVMEDLHQRLMREEINEQQLSNDKFLYDTFDEHWRRSQSYDLELYSLGHDKMADFIRRSMFQREGETVAVELLFVYDLITEQVWINPPNVQELVDQIIAAGGVPIASKIDRIDQISATSFKFYDYKTNILPFTRDEIENSLQLGVYAMVVKAVYPAATDIEGVFDMLRHGRFPVVFTQDTLEKQRAYLVNLWVQIRSLTEVEEKLNKYCRWCELRSRCSAYQGALRSESPTILTETTDTPEGLAKLFAEQERLANVIKVMEERRKEINSMLSAKVTTDSMGEPLDSGNFQYYLVQNPRYEFDKQQVFNLLRDKQALGLLPQMMSVSKTAMEAATKSRPELKEALSALLRKRFVSPTLKRRKIGGGTSGNTNETPSEEIG